MASLELTNYVKESLASGLTAVAIKDSLISAGWSQLDIDEAFKNNQPAGSLSPSAPTLKAIENIQPGAELKATIKQLDQHPTVAIGTIINKPWLKVVLISFLAILLLGALAYGGYWYYTNKMSTTGSLSADQALSKSLDLLQEAKAWKISGNLKINNLKLADSFDIKEINPHLGTLSPDAELLVSFSHAYDNSQGTVLALINSSGKVNINNVFGYSDWYGIEMLSTGKRAYAKLNGQGQESTKEVMEIMDDHWFEVNMKGVLEALKIKPEEMDNYRITDEERQQLMQVASSNKLFNIENLPEDKVDRKKAFHYKLTVNKEGLKKVLIKYYEIIKAKMERVEGSDRLSMLSEISDELLGMDFEEEDMAEEDIPAVIAKSIDNFNAWPQLDYWVDKSNYQPLQFTIANNIETPSKDFSGRYTLTINLDSLGETIVVVEPEKSFDLVGVIVSVVKKYFLSEDNDLGLGDARMRARDARRVSDVRQIQTALELYFNEAEVYPNAIKTGESIAYQNMVIMTKVPANAQPVDGDCPAQADYVYQVLEAGKKYILTYCLGAQTGEIPAGLNKASADKMTDKEPAPKLDRQRNGDVSNLRDYLENYFKVKEKYPTSLAELKQFMETERKMIFTDKEPVTKDNEYDVWGDYQSNSQVWPSNPKPVGAGCPDTDYAYQPNADFSNYTLQYCLNGDPSDYGWFGGGETLKGQQVADAWGATTAESQTNKLEAIQELIDTVFSDLISVTEVNSKSRDARRVSDVRQIQTALELYFNDASSYPKSVIAGQAITFGDLTYMAKVPGNPQPADADCPEVTYYKYQLGENGTSYTIDYCLANMMGSISEGPHVATPAGIDDLGPSTMHWNDN